MSRALTAIETTVSQLSSADWQFKLGTLREQNVEADDMAQPHVILRAPLQGNHEPLVNGLFRSTYNLVVSFVEQGEPEQTSAETIPVIDRCTNAALEFIGRLREAKDDYGVIFDVTAVSTVTLNHEYDMDWCGVMLNLSIELTDGYDLCLN